MSADIFINRMKTDIVSQLECEGGRVSGDGSPGDSLTLIRCIPDGGLGRLVDRCGPDIRNEKDGCREDGGGTHCC